MGKAPKYKIIIDQIKEWIATGEIQPGDKIYSEHTLANMFGVSRHTIRQAIGELVHEGVLYREQGAGTFCAFPSGNGEKNIGIITTYISDYIFPSIIRGIESYLTAKGYSLILSSTNNQLERERQCLEMMLNRPIDGLIIEPTKSSSYNPNLHYYLELEKRGIPYVMIHQFYVPLNPPFIILDDEKGGFLATEHLMKLGHQKIVGIFKTDDLQGMYRMKGFVQAFRQYGVPFKEDTIITYTTEEIRTTLRKKIHTLLTAESRPTGIICYNDEIALMVIQIAHELSISVPEELSIVGYDNSSLAETSSTQLTSIHHPKSEMGKEAARWIVEGIEKKIDLKEKQFIYEPELIVRQSTAPCSS